MKTLENNEKTKGDEMMDYPLGKIYAFDFDGTLTTRDTLIEFIRYVKGTKGLLKCMGRYLPLLVAMKMGLYPNWKAKQKVFAYCFQGMPLDQFDDYCQKFARDKVHLMRSEGMKKIDELLAEGHTVIIISASINNWVEPFFKHRAGVYVIGTMIESKDGRLSGRFLTKNCYGREKVNRLLQLFPERKDYWLTAYGDSRGDYELLDFANEGHYKPFR